MSPDERFTEEELRHAYARVFLALDTEDVGTIQRLGGALRDVVGGYKVGAIPIVAQLLDRCASAFKPTQGVGPRHQMRRFLDGKFADTPNTVVKACQRAARDGYDVVTVYAEIGLDAMRDAQAAASAIRPGTRLAAIGVLTSHQQKDGRDTLAEVGTHVESINVLMLDRIGAAVRAGLDHAVCSIHEVEALRAAFPGIKLIVPGCYTGTPKPGQERTGTPADAMRLGVQDLVVGREVLEAEDPIAALQKFALSMCEGMFPDRPDEPSTSC
jgi:orotidine-5'-phosphate decarboxylase